jgi:hypothetical protein
VPPDSIKAHWTRRSKSNRADYPAGAGYRAKLASDFSKWEKGSVTIEDG